MRRALIWFRSDLRVDDNPALAAAVDAADEGAVALFFVTPEQWRSHDWGAGKRSFVLRAARRLGDSLADLGIAFRVVLSPRFSDCPAEVASLMEELSCDGLFANREYEVNERARDDEVESLLREAGREMHWFHDQTVLPPGRLETQAGDFYSVFTPFKRRWVELLERDGIPRARAAPAGTGETIVEAAGLDILEEEMPGVDDRVIEMWPAGEDEAAERLERFVEERISAYGDDRDRPDLEATSCLSPYLAAGVLSIRRCLGAALNANRGNLTGGSKGATTWISELVWREFYRHVLVGSPRVSKNRAFRPETEAVAWRESENDFEAWREGRTGVPFVDAGMRQLAATGWMHNRLRMVTAMFLTKDLLLDWRLGERQFARHLVDLDLASNNGGWQWSASTGTDAAPYFRIMNPWTQGGRYDPDGAFVRRWVQELEDVETAALHDPKSLAEAIEAGELDYPLPIVEHKAARIRAVEAFEAIKED